LTNNSKEALLKAAILAKKFGRLEIENIHLLYAIYLRKGSVGSNILSDLGLNKEIFQQILGGNITKTEKLSVTSVAISANLRKNITKAFSTAREFGYPYVGTEHLVYSLLGSTDNNIRRLLATPSVQSKKQDIQQSLRAIMEPDILSNLSKMFNLPEAPLTKTKNTKTSATPFIDKFCLNLNEETKINQEIIVGREKEVERMINILGRKNKNNPLLIGDPGVGKTALVTGLAQMLNAGEVPSSLYRKKIMNLDVAQLIAGTSFRGEFESRLKEIIKEVKENRNIILFIDEIHNIVGAGNVPGSLDLANIIKPALARGEMQLIGATTQTEYKKYIEKDAALARRFQPIQVQEPTAEETKKILFGIKSHYEAFHNVAISADAIELAVDLSVRYVQNRFLPDKAIDVIDETASNIRSRSKISDFIHAIRKIEDEKLAVLTEKENLVSTEHFEAAINLRAREKELEAQIKLLQKKQADSEKENRIEIKAADIIETIAKISGIPAEKLSREKNTKIRNIQKILNSQVIGQTTAIQKLTGTLLRSQAGIGNPDRPLGSFLFLGPTGVGKTLTAKILAKEFFGNPKALIRIDMSELMERHSVSSLIGSPAGYIGYGEGGNLTEKVRKNPYAVVLFDEIEKAHPDVFNILLQILEDGVLTDAEGTPVSFKNTIVILTSNAGTDDFTNASKVGFETQQPQELTAKFNEIKEQTLKDLARQMRPELLNRLDYILVFDALGKKEIQQISALEIKKLQSRVKQQGVNLTFDKQVATAVADKSLAFNQGARLVRKNVQELLENPIAEMIIYDKVKNGKIKISLVKGGIKLT
jgi:ATP-dependent Clp protease ATP-binding subunit ClpC